MTEGYPVLETVTCVTVLSTAPVGPSDQTGTANKTLIWLHGQSEELFINILAFS